MNPTPIDRVQLLVRRRINGGWCALIAVEMEVDGRIVRGGYEPELFDDQPCEPLAQP